MKAIITKAEARLLGVTETSNNDDWLSKNAGNAGLDSISVLDEL